MSPGAQAPLHPGFGVHAPGRSFTLGTQPPSIPRRGAAQRSASRAYAAPGEEMRGRPRRSLPSRAAAGPPVRARGSTGRARAARQAWPHHLPGGAYINAAAALPGSVVGPWCPPAVSEPRCPPRPRRPAAPASAPHLSRGPLSSAQLNAWAPTASLRDSAPAPGAAARWPWPGAAPSAAPSAPPSAPPSAARPAAASAVASASALRPQHRLRPPTAPAAGRAHAGERRHDAGGRAHACRAEPCR